MPKNQESLGLLASHVGDALTDEVSVYAELVRAELSRESGQLASDLWPLLLAGPALILGLGLVSVGAGIGLSSWMEPALAWLLVGAVNLLSGGLAARLAVHRRRASTQPDTHARVGVPDAR